MVRFRADELDAAVLKAIDPYLPRNVDRAKTTHADLLRRLVRRIDVGPDDLLISLTTGATIAAPVTCRVRTWNLRKDLGKSDPKN